MHDVTLGQMHFYWGACVKSLIKDVKEEIEFRLYERIEPQTYDRYLQHFLNALYGLETQMTVIHQEINNPETSKQHKPAMIHP